MSHGQKQRTPANFPKMKHRAAGRLRRDGWRRRSGTHTGGYYCGEHGIRWLWENVTGAELENIENDIADHEDYHYSTETEDDE
jgi:hypothetical protein